MAFVSWHELEPSYQVFSFYFLIDINGEKKENMMKGRDGLENKIVEEMEVWGFTSKQYSLKNLSFTTNKDTRLELCLIVVAYFLHASVYNWEPTNSCFPTIGRSLVKAFTFACTAA